MPEAKSVFISGGATGIGAATAQRFAAAGWRVGIGYHSHKPEGMSGIFAVPLDLRDEESIRMAAQEVVSRFGSIDVLVNNAGALAAGAFTELPAEKIREQVEVNFLGLMELTRKLLPHLRFGIVNVGTHLAFVGKKNLVVYTAAKWAVRGFTKSLAREVPHLRICAVHPGATATAMHGFTGMAPEKVAEIIFLAAAGRLTKRPGADILVRHYRHGRALAPVYKIYDVLKKLIRFEL